MAHPIPLTFVEEIVLLALDDRKGSLRDVPPLAFHYSLAGALLGDLALHHRIDTDPERLFVVNPASVGDPLLDPALARIVAEPESHSVSRWLSIFSHDGGRLKQAALDRLTARGILRVEERKILWVLGGRRYPLLDNREATEVRTRLSALILSDDLPDPRDAVLIGLISACDLVPHIFPDSVHAARSERIAQLGRMDQIGRELGSALSQLAYTLASMNLVGY